jgi:broad specificity phosphatase PhoE
VAELFLVRHAQASFGTDDYDRLSDLGHQQSRWLGDYFAQRGLVFDRVVTGTLRRHRETLSGLAAGGATVAESLEHPGLNEYESDRLIKGWLRHTRQAAPSMGGDRRDHFRVMRDALSAWVDGSVDFAPHISFQDFLAGARAGLDLARADAKARRVLVVSSGGPISTLISDALGTELRAMVNLNLQMRNASFSEFHASAKVVRCVSFNNIPHMDAEPRLAQVTYS